jgi:hypothetical protein
MTRHTRGQARPPFTNLVRQLSSTVLTIATIVGSATSAFAADPPPTLQLPPGVACTYGLDIYASGGNQHSKSFTDKNGNVVRMITSGLGTQLRFVNHDTGASLLIKPSGGSVMHTTVNPDSTQTVSLTGHSTLILFDTDVPAGPSTTLYIGRVSYTVDAVGGFRITSTSGKQTDIRGAPSG